MVSTAAPAVRAIYNDMDTNPASCVCSSLCRSVALSAPAAAGLSGSGGSWWSDGVLCVFVWQSEPGALHRPPASARRSDVERSALPNPTSGFTTIRYAIEHAVFHHCMKTNTKLWLILAFFKQCSTLTHMN